MYPIFDKHFIYDSYSSRVGKGTHAGVVRLETACRKVSANFRKPAYTLKCDVRKFFDSIDHAILRNLILKKVTDPGTLFLIDSIFQSFEKEKGKGLPLGNVTSQLFANIYLNELDQFVKHQLKAKHYFRYCDDFVIVHQDKVFLENAIIHIKNFLSEKLALDLHSNKVEIRKLRQGIDFLGYVGPPHVRVLRTKTKKRIVRKLQIAQQRFLDDDISKETYDGVLASYHGVVSHSKNHALIVEMKKKYNL